MSVGEMSGPASPDVFRLFVDAPARFPDWRWRLTQHGRRLNRRTADRWLIAANTVFEAVRPPAATAGARATPSVENDWRIYENCRVLVGTAKTVKDAWVIYAGKNYSLRYELEARLLAQQPITEIAEKLHQTPATLEAYANVFFHVYDRIESETWVIHCVFGDEYHTGGAERSYPLWWKAFAYYGGVQILETVIRKTQANPGMSWEEFMNAERQFMLDYKSMVAARTMSVNSFTGLPILQHAHTVKKDALDGAATTAVADGLMNVLSHVRVTLQQPEQLGSPVEPRQGMLLSAELNQEMQDVFSRKAEHPTTPAITGT